ncbi:MAG: FG-GAP repeat domain-containing protein [Verrucomicrobiaceae bacterium]
MAADEMESLRERTIALIQAEEMTLVLSPRHAAIVSWLEEGPESFRARLNEDLASLSKGRFIEEEIGWKEGEGAIQQRYLALGESVRDLSRGENPFGVIMPGVKNWRLSNLGVVSVDLDVSGQLTLQTKLEASGKLRSGEAFGFKGEQEIVWQKEGEEWVLSEWNQQSAKVSLAKKTFFSDVSKTAVPDSSAFWKMQKFEKKHMIDSAMRTGVTPVPDRKYLPYISAENDVSYPSVAVVDYDGDGFEDLFLNSDWDAAQMLRNKGDGTFEDVTRETGLRFNHSTTCAVFVDFDNDGDKDAFIGRSQEPSVFLENREGKFHDVTAEKTNLGDLYFVSAVSVCDFNRDGLPDLYASTYGPVAHANPRWESVMLPKEEWEIFQEKEKGEHRWFNLIGSANVLMINQGDGKFKRHPYDELISQWRRSFQSVWGDFDGDGDDDLYICNDFAPDELLRNDTPKGGMEPVFVNVSAEAFASKPLGFGMGASWGDYDGDGDLDLYVSNMYSKAGKRIIKQMGAVNERVKAAAAGNFLYEFEDGKFHQRAGSEEGEQQVNVVGWSYGGQFGDFNNDGETDLYVPSGYYSAPEEHSTFVDT